MEAIDERYCCIFCYFGFDVLANGGGAEYAKVLPFTLAKHIGLDGGDEQIVSKLGVVILFVKSSTGH
jgi:hypothetical protein